MGDYMRFFFYQPPLTLDDVDAGFQSLDPKFRLRRDEAAPNTGDLLYADEVYAEVEVNSAGGELFLEEVEELRDILNDGPDEDYAARQYVISLLGKASGLIALKVSDFGNVYYDRIDPIWDRLFERHAGLLQVDDEGYYDQHGTLLSLE